jgi:uncharacterized protein YbjT (DUF2867 family)
VRAGVDHVVKITNTSSPDSPIARRRNQHEIEAALIGSGIGYTLLRNNAYMQNFLMLARSIAQTDAFGSSIGEGRIGLVDTRDVGAVAAQIAASPAGHAGRTYWPSGPERLSYADVAAVLSRVLDRWITFRPLTFEEDKQGMIAAGAPCPHCRDEHPGPPALHTRRLRLGHRRRAMPPGTPSANVRAVRQRSRVGLLMTGAILVLPHP